MPISFGKLRSELGYGIRETGARSKLAVLEKWQQFISNVPPSSSLTVIASEFGATYPIDGPLPRGVRNWQTYKGAFGQSLAGVATWNELLPKLPHYVRERKGRVPEWLKSSITYSRSLYKENHRYLDRWKNGLTDAHNSWHKFEWRGNRQDPDIWNHLIQFRASGIRIMRSEFAPSLVAMTPTQTPIIGPLKRYMGVREAAALQSLDELTSFPKFNGSAFKALGNAVNAHIVSEIAKKLIR